jgi:hypothetical protein
LHRFFEAIYEDYDIVIWSANSMKWMIVKMTALGVLGHEAYHVAFMLDGRSMLTVHTQKHGSLFTPLCSFRAAVAALSSVWHTKHGKIPRLSSRSCLLFDVP